MTYRDARMTRDDHARTGRSVVEQNQRDYDD
jgi:hypothetical protein